LLATSSTKT